MNKNGFTLVELLVVIALIGLLTVIAVPSALTISKKVKQSMMDSKIELIESGSIVWGQNNKSDIYTLPYASTVPDDAKCTKANTDSNVKSCIRKTIDVMLNTENAFKEDEQAEDGTKLLINPTTDASINNCYVEIYIKNKRVYAKYDTDPKATCYYITE